MNIYKEQIASAIEKVLNIPSEDLIQLISESPADVEGDYAFPCFSFCRTMRKSPEAIAADILKNIDLPDLFSSAVNIKGFLNFCVDRDQMIKRVLSGILTDDALYGQSQSGENKTIVIDFSSPNMGKELAFHHLRGTMLGNSLSRLYLASGFKVIRINHIGDWGTSYGKLILMYTTKKLPQDHAFLEDLDISKLNELYQSFGKASQEDPQLEDRAREIFRDLENGNNEYRNLWKAFRETTLKELRRLYSILDVEFDLYKGEADFVESGRELFNYPALQKLISEGDGGSRIIKFNEKENLPPLLLAKSDGSTLYATRDISAAIFRNKQFGFSKNLYVVDNGQRLHFKQFFKVLELMGLAWAKKCEHIPFGLILTKGSDGKWERGKTRVGGVSLLREVLETARDQILEIINEKNPELPDAITVAQKIATGALVFNDLKTGRLNDVNFDWDTVMSFDGDTGPYITNAHVRLCSILRKAEERKNTDIFKLLNDYNPDYSKLTDSYSLDLIRDLEKLPDKISRAVSKHEPSIICQYMLGLAEKSHAFIHNCKVLGSREEMERLYLVNCTRIVLRNSLYLTGIPVVDRM